MRTLTMKFGGLSVSTPSALTQVVSIILQECERWEGLIVVVSALEGVTDALLEATHLAQLSNRRGYRRIVATIRTRHLALIEKLPLGVNERSALQADIDQLLFEMLDVCQTISELTADQAAPDKTDAIIGVGERMAARIVAALVRQNGLRGVAIDATELIITDDTFGNAVPNLADTQFRINQYLLPMLDRKIIPVITGFIGGTRTGKPTTLGRGGSDYSASILSVCANAAETWMWTNVDGLMSTDPNEVPDAKVIPQLAYEEVAELAYFGARILHARMIGPLHAANIPLRIKNVFKPQLPGTLISTTQVVPPTKGIKAVTSIQGIGLLADHSGSLSAITEFANEVLTRLIGSEPDVTITAQSSARSFLCFVIPTSAGPDAIHTIQVTMAEKLQAYAHLSEWRTLPVSIITAVGANLDTQPRVLGALLDTLIDIRILALWQGPSGCSLSIVVEPSHGEEALHRIHRLTTNSGLNSGQAPTA